MIELADTQPTVDVQPAELQRLLGYPREHVLDGRALDLADEARAWYAAHGRPWVYARQSEHLSLEGDDVRIDGVSFTSARLASTLRDANAHAVVLVAVSAGGEIEAEAQRRWTDEKPDEYFFLEVYGSAVVEHLIARAGGRLCALSDPIGIAVLPHYSPGYPEWAIADQAALFSLIAQTQTTAFPGAVEVMESGMLRPKKSLLAVFGLTAETERVRKLGELVPCESCSLPGCQYRRTAYRRPRRRGEVEAMRPLPDAPPPVPEPLTIGAKYSVNAKALRRWIVERLDLTHHDDGTIAARFRYEGTTCSNLGRPFAFEYDVMLSSREDRYRVLQQACAPAPNDEGHRFMCRYRSAAAPLMASIAEEKPLLGRPLDDVLSWSRPAGGPTCYCEGESRAQKWGLVLETIHYALAQREQQLASALTPQESQAR